LFNLVELEGVTSNSVDGVCGDLSSLLSNAQELDEIFKTLAEWNDYLENHVPYFQEEVQTLVESVDDMNKAGDATPRAPKPRELEL